MSSMTSVVSLVIWWGKFCEIGLRDVDEVQLTVGKMIGGLPAGTQPYRSRGARSLRTSC